MLLNARQLQIVRHAAEGLRNKEIAQELGVTRRIVEHDWDSIFNIVDCHDRTGATVRVLRTLEEL